MWGSHRYHSRKSRQDPIPVEIRSDGYIPYTSTGQVIAGQNIQISAALTPVPVATPTKKAATGPES